MHIRCGSRMLKKGFWWKRRVPDYFLGNFLQFSLQLFLFFLEKSGFYTLEPPGSSTMVIGSNIRWYREFKGWGGGANIVKARTRSNNNVFTYYVVLVTFSIKERMSIPETWIIVFNATFSNTSAISLPPVIVVEEAGVPGENHRPWPSNW